MSDQPDDQSSAIAPFDANASIFTRGLAIAQQIRKQGPIRVLIVDDIEDTTSNLAKLLAFEEDMQTVGIAYDGQEAIRLARETHPASCLSTSTCQSWTESRRHRSWLQIPTGVVRSS